MHVSLCNMETWAMGMWQKQQQSNHFVSWFHFNNILIKYTQSQRLNRLKNIGFRLYVMCWPLIQSAVWVLSESQYSQMGFKATSPLAVLNRFLTFCLTFRTHCVDWLPRCVPSVLHWVDTESFLVWFSIQSFFAIEAPNCILQGTFLKSCKALSSWSYW